MEKVIIKTGVDDNGKQLKESITVYSSLPKGWVKGDSTIFNKKRFVWIHENKSLFTEEGRQQALLILK